MNAPYCYVNKDSSLAVRTCGSTKSCKT